MMYSSMRFGYRANYRRSFKIRFGLSGLVEDHHIIPKQWKDHHNLKAAKFSIDAPYNLMLLPSSKGSKILNTNRIFHSGGHPLYNLYVKHKLDSIESRDELYYLVNDLRQDLIKGGNGLPWR